MRTCKNIYIMKKATLLVLFSCLLFIANAQQFDTTEVEKGFNVFGIRFRHQICEEWIREARTIDFVLSHLRDANFDHEFYKKHELEIIESFNNENPDKNINLQPKRFYIRRSASMLSKIKQ